MGIRASSTPPLYFADCRVPKDALLGGEGKGFRVAMQTLDGGRIGISAQALGIAQGALDASIAYAKERVQFGKPIASFEAIQWMIADMATEIDAARFLVYRAASCKDKGRPYSTEAAMAKLFASETATRVAGKAIQIHGGAGLHGELSGRAGLSRRQDHRDLRRNLRGATSRYRDKQFAMTQLHGILATVAEKHDNKKIITLKTTVSNQRGEVIKKVGR